MGRHPHRERSTALQLARRHPGWSTARIGREVGAHRASVHRWLFEENLAPANPRVHRGDGPRRQAVELTCGHFGVPPYSAPNPTGWCWQCRAYMPLGRSPRLEHEQRLRVAELQTRSGIGQPPDSAPFDPASVHWSERPAADVIADLIDRWRNRGRDVDAIIAEELRRAGIDPSHG